MTLGILHQIEYYSQMYRATSMKIKKPGAYEMGPSLVFPYGFFDGAATNHKGGIGFCLVLNESHSFEFAMGAGLCTNTKVELIALWALLSVAKLMGIPCLNIFGDSTIIINWAKCHASLDLSDLIHWCMDTRRLISCFLHSLQQKPVINIPFRFLFSIHYPF